MAISRRRSLFKTISFRVLATLTTFVLVIIFTGDYKIAGAVGLLEFFSKLVLYYAHERVWDKLRF